jgi:hypothetical protein
VAVPAPLPAAARLYESGRVDGCAAAKLQARFDDVTETQDAALLGGLFARQGLVSTPVSERFRAEFFGAATEASRRLGAELHVRDLRRGCTSA